MAQAASAGAQPQTSIYEKTIEDPALEELLDKRATARDKAATASREARHIADQVKEAIEKLDLADAPVRIGGYVVAIRPVASRTVNFETAATTRLVIKPLPDAA